MQIDTQNLQLRPIRKEDALDIFEYATDADTGPRAGWEPHKTIADTLEIIDIWLKPNNLEKVYALVYKANQKVVGTMGVVHLNEQTKDAKNTIATEMIDNGKSVYEIGVTISKDYWGKGIATEALSSMIDYIFDKLNADIVLTLHYAANVGSKRVQEKNNMKVLGSYQRDKAWYNTDCKEMIVRGKTRDEWLQEKESNYTK